MNMPASELTSAGQYAPRKIKATGVVQLTGINFQAWFGTGDRWGLASLAVYEEKELAYANVIENFLRIHAAHSALPRGGVLLHSAGLVFGNQAYLFCGRSNVGKTTLTRKAHAQGARVLSDDINLVLPDDAGYRAHAVPFTGEFGRTLRHEDGNSSYALAGILLLEQADELSTAAVQPAGAVARLLTGCPFVNTDPQESASLFDVLTDLVSRVPVIRLRSRRDDTIETIMQAVREAFHYERRSRH